MKLFSSFLDSHLSDNFTIHEVGVKLSPENKTRIKNRLKQLEDRTPVNSSIQLKFTAQKKGIVANLTIIGSARRFCCQKRGANPWSLYKTLEKEIDRQLTTWKKTRFIETQPVISLNEKFEKQMRGVAL